MEDHDKEIEILLKKKRENGTFRQYWRAFINSAHRNMSVGAEYINKIITRPHKDECKRGREKKK